MRFLFRSHARSNRAHRLKHLLLLLCRMAVLLLLVGMLMRARYTPAAGQDAKPWIHTGAAPVSAVLCFDTSASMGYRYQGRTRLERAVGWARDLLDDSDRFPPGSEIAIVTGRQEEPAWSLMNPAIRRKLELLRAGEHGTGVARMLQPAWQLLKSARHPRREVYLFNDLTAQSWRELPTPPPEECSAVFVLDVGQAENRNISMSWSALPQRELAADRPAQLRIRLRSGDEAAEPVLDLQIDGELRNRQSLAAIEPRAEVEIAVALPGLSRGLHAVELKMEPQDALSFDNRRFATVQVGDLPRVLIVGAPDAEVPLLIRAMIAPSAQMESQRGFEVLTRPTLRKEDVAGAHAVILSDPGELGVESWRALGEFVASGGWGLVIPGPASTAQAFRGSESLLAAAVLGVEDCPQPLALAASDFSHPYLLPFTDPTIDSLNARLAFQRVRLGPVSPDARIVVPFSDGAPAMLTRAVGQGQLVQLAFSPAREWGQFGTQAAPLITLLHTMLATVLPPARNIAHYVTDQPATCSGARAGATGLFIRGPTQQTPKALIPDSGQVRLPTSGVGCYQVSADPGGLTPVLAYAVNAADDESVADRIAEAQIRPALPGTAVVVAADSAKLAASQLQASRTLQLFVPLGLAVLALLLIESLFSNWFYGRGHRRASLT